MSWLCALVLAWVSAPPPNQATASVIPGCTGVTALSSDGKTLLVTQRVGPHETAAVWTRAAGVTLIPLPNGYSHAVGTAISGDGSTVAGHLVSGVYDGRGDSPTAFRWTRAAGTQLLTPGTGWDRLTSVRAMSHDGSVIVGHGIPAGIKGQGPVEAFKWSKPSGAEHLGFLDPAFPYSSAECVSRDGKVVGGWGGLSHGGTTSTGGRMLWRKPIIWVAGQEKTVVDTGQEYRAEVRGVSPSGNLFLIAEKGGDHVWSRTQRTIELPSIPPREINGMLAGSGVHTVQSDAPIVRGYDGSLWTPKSGWVTRDKILALAGRKEEDGFYVAGYSDDLTVMAGGGEVKNGKPYGWIITFPPGAIQKLLNEPKPPLLSRPALIIDALLKP